MDDVEWNVYNRYIKGKNYVATSFFRKANLRLALERRGRPRTVVEESWFKGAEAECAFTTQMPVFRGQPPSSVRTCTVEP